LQAHPAKRKRANNAIRKRTKPKQISRIVQPPVRNRMAVIATCLGQTSQQTAFRRLVVQHHVPVK
jgi:hypothetical protein